MVSYKQLQKIYEDVGHPCGYSGIEKLTKYFKNNRRKISKKQILEFLKNQPAWSYHGLIPRKFVRRPIKVSRPGHILGVDIADFTKTLSKYNNNFRYVLVLIDCFSRKLCLSVLRNKSNQTTADAIEDFLKKSEYKYRYIFSDEGGEFIGSHTHKIYEKFNIVRYSVKNRRYKCSIAERVIRTIKEKIYKYFTQKNTFKYVNVLKKVEDVYNNTPHRGLCFATPNSVHNMTDLNDVKHQEKLQLRQKFHNYGSISKREKSKLFSSKNDFIHEGYVRLLLNKSEGVFAKSFQPIFTEEIFKIRTVKKTLPISYWLEDLKGLPIEGVVYEKEIKPVKLPKEYVIEKILSTHTDVNTRKKKYFVKWRGYPNHFNSYVDAIKKVK